MAIDQLTLINAACAQIGADPIDALDDDTPSGQAAALIYDSLLGYCVGLFEWPFALATRQLSQRAGVTPLSGYTTVYALPADRIEEPVKAGPRADWPRQHFTDYTLQGGDLHCDQDTMYALIRTLPLPIQMSSTFRKTFQHGLAAELAMAIASDKALKSALWNEAFGPPTANGCGGLMGSAIQAARKSQPTFGPFTNSDPLTAAHVSGGGTSFP